jgi:hypothetical protein
MQLAVHAQAGLVEPSHLGLGDALPQDGEEVTTWFGMYARP